MPALLCLQLLKMKCFCRVFLALLLAWARGVMELDDLADIILQHQGGAGNHQPQQPARPMRGPRNPRTRGRGGRRGAGLGPGQAGQGVAALAVQNGRQRGRGRGMVRGGWRHAHQRQNVSKKRRQAVSGRHEQRRHANSRLQAISANDSGRCRTVDHLFPMSSNEKRAQAKGSGAWKVWTPEAVLRSAFSQPSSALRQVAAEIDGASPAQISACRAFVSSVILQEQEKGLNQLKNQARHLAVSGSPPLFWLLNLMFDETELELKLDEDGPGAWSILASHSQLSVCFNSDPDDQNLEVRDIDVFRLPQALPRKTASCMWSALCLEPGGLGQINLCHQAKFLCIMVTCDQAAANIKLLKHLHARVPEKCFVLPMMCAQHRNGNVVEQVTKLLGILPGSYCLAKCSSKGAFFKSLREAVKKQLQQDLIVLDGVPPGLQVEWAEAAKQATSFLQLLFEGLADASPSEQHRGKNAALIAKFVDFFRSPWKGLRAGKGGQGLQFRKLEQVENNIFS